MTHRKRLITRIATGSAAALVAGLLGVGGVFVADRADEERFAADREAERQATLEASRAYLSQVAGSIDRLPVDPALVAEVESRYFEERPRGPMQVWAMGVDGEFLFGVPSATFSRLNAIYDREITPRLEDGVFLDRQSFLLGNLDEGDDLQLARRLMEERDSDDEDARRTWERLAREAFRSDGTFVLSTPLRTAEGGALGSLYLRRTPPERRYYRTDERLEAAAGIFGGLAGLSFALLWVLLPAWVYVDARERGARRAPLFAFLTAISSVVGLLVYLIARPEEPPVLACPGCGREVNGGAYCPHCGRDLSASFCGTCRYPLKPDWSFCPSCRAEVGSPNAPDAEASPTEV